MRQTDEQMRRTTLLIYPEVFERFKRVCKLNSTNAAIEIRKFINDYLKRKHDN